MVWGRPGVDPKFAIRNIFWGRPQIRNGKNFVCFYKMKRKEWKWKIRPPGDGYMFLNTNVPWNSDFIKICSLSCTSEKIHNFLVIRKVNDFFNIYVIFFNNAWKAKSIAIGTNFSFWLSSDLWRVLNKFTHKIRCATQRTYFYEIWVSWNISV